MTKPSTALALTGNNKPRKYHGSRARTRTGRWRALFLKALAKTPSVTFAAKAAGVNRRTVYAHREQDSDFAAKWDDALNQSLDVLEHAVYQRALKDDAQLAMFLLKAHRPSIYRERIEAAVAGGIVLIPSKSEGSE
ncbi:MAG: hypothetical protein DME99_03680 [Verrucomicrobia bacterium]|nr:MAG: hypothetical protein DME99_03680 [Verrucomicrobiota bacterium]